MLAETEQATVGGLFLLNGCDRKGKSSHEHDLLGGADVVASKRGRLTWIKQVIIHNVNHKCLYGCQLAGKGTFKWKNRLLLNGCLSLYHKMSNSDTDFRYMALNDLTNELQKENFSLEDSTEQKVLRAVLKLLEDKNGEVQNLAVKW